MALRIIRKRWNNEEDQIITHVQVEGEETTEAWKVWDRIKAGEFFYVLVQGRQVTVIAKAREGKKYLTTNPDGFKPNNLDELPNC
jgi:hypothetical protein